MQILYYYRVLIGIPLNFVLNRVGMILNPWLYIAYEILVSLLLLYLVYKFIMGVGDRIRKFFKKDTLLEPSDMRGYTPKDSKFAIGLQAAQDLEATVAPLKKARDYERLGEVYASVNRYKESAKYYKKAKNLKQAAEMFAKAGQTVKAARLLLKEGDFETAARFFREKEKYVEAAKAHDKAGQSAEAADAYALARRYDTAVGRYNEYFADSRDNIPTQLEAARKCLEMLEDSKEGKAKVTEEQRASLVPQVAARFEQGKEYDTAARLFQEAGNLVHAGEVYVLAGKLREAAACLKSAGREKEAAQITGRFYEKQGKWPEAAMAYAAAGEYVRAGDCYAKTSNAVRSAECYEKAGEFYGAGLAYTHSAAYGEAIRVLQKIHENDRNFDQSRALLGRCFYELHDYEHCAATLDNHLTGKRVESGNVEYFYMLALAYEQAGKLEESQEILYKIRSLDVGFRDVTQRISNISSRISMRKSEAGAAMTPTYHGSGVSGDEQTRVMGNVQTNVGQRYQLEKELGRGGMGIVYLAKDTQLDRPVALKFLGNLIDDSEEFRQRFVREARAAAKINHPNIISIYDISATMGKAYIAMEYVQGGSLVWHLKQRGKLAPREAVNVVGQTCAALAAVHEAGIIHRDIKPDNILIAKGGLVKITDFGLAKSADSRLTRTGTSMGTPSYMSPEQVLGKEADVRSDIYSLGLVLHEVLTGKVVFADGNVLERQLEEMPPLPSAVTEGIPEELDAVVLKCVAKKPEDRFQTAREMHAALRAVKT